MASESEDMMERNRENINVEITDDFLKSESEEISILRPVKRDREEGSSDGEWHLVGKKKLRQSISTDPESELNQITISCKEKLPKAFALAKILKKENISNILKVKYINSYRVRITLQDEVNLKKLCSCEGFLKMGWRIHKDMEVSFSYGVMKDVELELEEKEILKSISCPGQVELVSVRRLNRRIKGKDGWWPCEVVQLCFKGNTLPPYVYTDGMRIAVEPYVFGVSQCSQCWKLGHSAKM